MKDPFPSHQIQLVDQPQSSASSGSQVYMMATQRISISTQSKDYQTPQKKMMEKEVTDTPSTSAPPSSIPLHIERPNNEYSI